jgi:hypothetical protein
MSRGTVQQVRELARKHQVVTLVGARGTGKTEVGRSLQRVWDESGLSVVWIDARIAQTSADLNEPLADAIACTPDDLNAVNLSSDQTVRVIVDSCESLHGKPWLAALQAQWRALLSSEAARGVLGVVLLGRPLFRQIAGGHGSPLLNLGPVVTTTSMSYDEVDDLVTGGAINLDARIIHGMSAGHPGLTRLLIEATSTSDRTVKDHVDAFVTANRRYIHHLVEDHPIGGRAMLGDLLTAKRPVQDATLIRAHYGAAYADGLDALEDLVASGLVRRTQNGECSIGAKILLDVPALRDLLRTPSVEIPDTPGPLGETVEEIFRFENHLRRAVADNLADHDNAWWATRIPPELAGEAEARRRTEANLLGQEDAALHPLMYLGLGEIFDIVFERPNWDQVFRVVTGLNLEGAQDTARRLVAIRNRAAHSRPVRPGHIEEFRTAADHLGLMSQE